MAQGLDILKSLAQRKLEPLHTSHRYRQLPVATPCSLDYSSNDYLGLGQDLQLQEQLQNQLKGTSTSSGSSRLLLSKPSGHLKLEEDFAAFKGTESATLLPTGYAANEALIQALSLKGVQFFYDTQIHASSLDGIKASPLPAAYKHSFAHNNLQDLTTKLRQAHAKAPIIFIEALYSMQGDFAPLEPLKALAQDYGATLVVDEAHSLGCFGSDGSGLAKGPDLISVNPCGKALAAQGGFICGPSWLKELLVNTARKFIFTTAPSPLLIKSLEHLLPALQLAASERQRLQELSYAWHHELTTQGISPTSQAPSPIIMIPLGTELRALHIRNQLLQHHGILCAAIRPPTVAKGSSCLRFSLNCHHDLNAMHRTIQALTKELAHAP